MNFPLIYLASRSPRRKAILKEAKIPFRVVPSNYPEKTVLRNPRKTVLQNAIGKATHVQSKLTQARIKKGIILGADTIVYLRGQIIGKPKSREGALRMLRKLSGSTHDVYTGIALYHLKSQKWKTACVRSRVKMRQLSTEMIRYYHSKVSPLDKAGAYAIQKHSDPLIAEIKGSYSNVVGLPIETLRDLLKKLTPPFC